MKEGHDDGLVHFESDACFQHQLSLSFHLQSSNGKQKMSHKHHILHVWGQIQDSKILLAKYHWIHQVGAKLFLVVVNLIVISEKSEVCITFFFFRFYFTGLISGVLIKRH